jgi:hypothetical protein
MKAFPNKGYESESLGNKYGGMDLRDYFASHAMQAIITNSDTFSNHIEEVDIWVGNYAYTVADAMMKARNK